MSAYAYEEIEKSLYEIDKESWAALTKLRVSPSLGAGPSPPRLPENLRLTIRSYARHLFDTEANEYSPYSQSTEMSRWLAALADRVASRVLKAIQSIDNSFEFRMFGVKGYGLSWHGLTPEAIEAAIKEELEETKARWLTRYQPVPQLEIEKTESGQNDESGDLDASQPEPRPPEVGLIEYRAKLLADYKSATGDPSNMRLYRAANSGIHKPDFYSWIKGTLPERSKVSKRFETFLKAKRLPIPRKPTS